jgi:phage gp45-like
MIRTGIVTGRELKKNRDSGNDRLLLQVQITDADDIHTVEYMSPPGEDSNPPNGTKVLIVDVGRAYKVAIAADDNISPSMAEGEKKLYSISSGTIAAFINFLQSGIVEINGNNDFAVRFNELETGFNQFRTDFNNFVTIFNAHTQVVSGGVAQIPAVPGVQTTADISAAKVNEVKLP